MSRWRWFGGGVSILVVGLLSGARVPLYDGIGFPDEPYKAIPQAMAIKKIIPVVNGTNSEILMQTAEQGPQLLLYLPAGMFKLPADVGQLSIAVTPKAADVPPKDGTVAGNVYSIDLGDNVVVSPSGSDATSTAVSLRFPQNISVLAAPYIAFRKPGGTWSKQPTLQTGTDIYKVQFAGFGEYTMVAPYPVSANTKHSSVNQFWVIGIIAGVIISMVLTIGIVRRSSTTGK